MPPASQTSRTIDDLDAAATWEVEDSPFALVPHDLIEDLDLPHTAVRVYCYLMRRAKNETKEAFPGYRRIGAEIGMSTATVAKCIGALETRGWIDVTRSTTKKKQRIVNHYFIRRTRRGVANSATPVAKTDTGGVAESATELDESLTTTTELHSLARPRDLLWEVFTEIHGQPATKSERGKYNTIVKTLKTAEVDETEYPVLVQGWVAKTQGLQPAAATISERVGEIRHFVAKGPVKQIDLAALERARWAEEEDRKEALT